MIRIWRPTPPRPEDVKLYLLRFLTLSLSSKVLNYNSSSNNIYIGAYACLNNTRTYRLRIGNQPYGVLRNTYNAIRNFTQVPNPYPHVLQNAHV